MTATSLHALFPGGFDASKIPPIAPGTDLVDPVGAFAEHCVTNGLILHRDGIIPDGQIHRVMHNSSKKNELDAWYVLHVDGKVPVGVCGCWKGFEFESKWVANVGRELGFAERLEHDLWVKQLVEAKRLAREAAQSQAAERAEEEIGVYADASEEHPYLQRKRVKPHGIKVDRAGRLVVPILNADGEIISHQTIDGDGVKRYLKGGRVDGGFYELRGQRQVLFIGEGFATCASVYEATGYTVFVAFDKGNLLKVAKVAREMFPGSKIIIAADNDQFTDGNPGVTAAHEASNAVRGEMVYPTFSASEVLAGKPTDFNDLHCLRGLDAVREQIDMVAAPIKDKLAFEFSRVDSLELAEIQWIVDDYIESDSLAQVFGDPGGGKSFVSIDIACCIATGTPWHGHEVKQGAVFYVAGEGHNGLARRFHAWALGNQVSLQGVPLYKSHRAAQLYDATEAAIVANSIKKLSEDAGCKPSMVIIDTLARNMGGDENSTEDMNAFIQHLDTYLRQPYKCCVLVVHHSGAMDKDRSRGSTALRGALDAEYRCQLDQSSKMIQFESKKMKDAELPQSKAFTITQVDLPLFDKRGEAVKGAYLTTVDISGLMEKVNKKAEFLGKNQRIALNALVSLEYQNAQLVAAGDLPLPIDNDAWRITCGERDLPRTRYAEARDALLAKNMVSESANGHFRTCQKASEFESESDGFGVGK